MQRHMRIISITPNNFPAGNYQLSIVFEHTYKDSEGYDESEYYYYYPIISVINPINAKDASAVYSANANYKAEIKDANGNPFEF
ncbi:MAG: hypothetical protein U0L42_09305 [Methanobrevibacter sp.]|uniref:hypothetical protein n=1 Tax=Methanobrevibacter sp. TaxID=66852 RepID=UPI002E75C42C|nr:hypothetical protein [Methanobrevibacter sp.]MEE0935857.1 hypothetical protein [Methanobrevibacter sp.]